MNILARLVAKHLLRREEIVESYLESIVADEPELVKMFADYALAHRCSNKLMKVTARRVEVDNRQLTKSPPRQVLFGDGPLPTTDFEVLCGVPMLRKEAEKIVAMNADDRTDAMFAHCIKNPEHRVLFQNWLNGSNHGRKPIGSLFNGRTYGSGQLLQ